MQNRTVRLLFNAGLAALLAALAGGCELKGPVGSGRIDAGARTDGGPSRDLVQGDASQPGWAIQVGGDGADSIWEVAVDDKAGDVIVLGKFSGTMKLEGTKGPITLTSGSSESTFIAKLDPDARKWRWAEAAAGAPMSVGETVMDGFGIDAEGNIYHTGQFKGTATFGSIPLTSAGDLDIFVTKRAPDGKVLWAVSAGGPGEDVAAGLAVGKDGKITICGACSGTAAFGAYSHTARGSNDLYVARLDPASGKFLWAAGAGSDSTTLTAEYAIAVVVDGSGNSYITGTAGVGAAFDSSTISGGAEVRKAFVAKADPAGKFLWAFGLDGVHGTSIALDKGGDIYVLAGANLDARALPPYTPGNVLVVHRGYCSHDSWVSVWPAQVTAKGMLAGYRLLVDESSSDSVVSGVFPGRVQFGPTLLTSSWTGSSGFLAPLGSDGIFKPGARAIVGSQGSATSGLARDKTGGLYVVGQFAGTATIGGTSLKSSGAASAFDGFIWYTGRGLGTL